jgi:hypothetical protein
MNIWGIVAILGGLALVWYVLSPKSYEGFETSFVDNTNAEKTDQTRVSSYAQQTNSFKPTEGPYEQPSGVETPYRVNIWNSFVPV